MGNLVKTLIDAAFKQINRPTSFLRSLFRSPPENQFRGVKIEIDSVRGKDEYAIDVIRHAGGRANKATVFTRKEYPPPMYDEYSSIPASELDKVQPGSTVYDLPDYAGGLADILLKEVMFNSDKIERATELLCRDALVLGKITLKNGDIIDFKQKASHQFSTPIAWTASTADPFADFSEVAFRVHRDSGRAIGDAIFGAVALAKFLNNENVKESGDLRRIERISVTSPLAPVEGAVHHGIFTAGNYAVNIWAYPEQVRVPMGFGLPNEGDKVPYIPDDKIIVIPLEPDFRLYYAGIPVISDNVSDQFRSLTGLPEVPTMEMGKILPYFTLDKNGLSIKAGARSAPLPVPVDIDSVIIITVT